MNNGGISAGFISIDESVLSDEKYLSSSTTRLCKTMDGNTRKETSVFHKDQTQCHTNDGRADPSSQMHRSENYSMMQSLALTGENRVIILLKINPLKISSSQIGAKTTADTKIKPPVGGGDLRQFVESPRGQNKGKSKGNQRSGFPSQVIPEILP